MIARYKKINYRFILNSLRILALKIHRKAVGASFLNYMISVLIYAPVLLSEFGLQIPVVERSGIIPNSYSKSELRRSIFSEKNHV